MKISKKVALSNIVSKLSSVYFKKLREKCDIFISCIFQTQCDTLPAAFYWPPPTFSYVQHCFANLESASIPPQIKWKLLALLTPISKGKSKEIWGELALSLYTSINLSKSSVPLMMSNWHLGRKTLLQKLLSSSWDSLWLLLPQMLYSN